MMCWAFVNGLILFVHQFTSNCTKTDCGVQWGWTWKLWTDQTRESGVWVQDIWMQRTSVTEKKLLLHISNYPLWLSWRLVGESLQFNATKCCSLGPNVRRSTALIIQTKTVAEVCYTGMYERKVKCFVITCALTTVIQLKVIISKELSPMFSSRYTVGCVSMGAWT